MRNLRDCHQPYIVYIGCIGVLDNELTGLGYAIVARNV